jgi:hypothetical protein
MLTTIQQLFLVIIIIDHNYSPRHWQFNATM